MAKRRRKRRHGTGSYAERNGRYQVQWTAGGRRLSKTVDTEVEALQFLAAPTAPAAAGACSLGAHAHAWIASRAAMASNYDDRNRWTNHLAPALGALLPDEVDVPVLKRTIVTLREKGLSKGTVGLCVRLLSSLYGELVEDGAAKLNPVRLLSKKTRAQELTSDWDPKLTPFVRDVRDVQRIFRSLDSTSQVVARAYVIGALAGLRTGEVRALRWDHVDLERRLIHVQAQVARRGGGVSTPKDDDSRSVPISDALLPILVQAVAAATRRDLVCPPVTDRGFLGAHGMAAALSAALTQLGLPDMTWYEATRHTFASQWVLHGGTLEKLQEMMGHSSVTTTERYAHLIPGNYTAADRARVAVEVLSAST